MLLILPVLLPSWRFFQSIEPSPRVQWKLPSERNDATSNWQEFRPRPHKVALFEMIRRLFWNPAWNEALYLVSCAERIQQSESPHSIGQIRQRILFEIARLNIDTVGKSMQFRLAFVHRGDEGLTTEVVFLSEPYAIASGERS